MTHSTRRTPINLSSKGRRIHPSLERRFPTRTRVRSLLVSCLCSWCCRSCPPVRSIIVRLMVCAGYSKWALQYATISFQSRSWFRRSKSTPGLMSPNLKGCTSAASHHRLTRKGGLKCSVNTQMLLYSLRVQLLPGGFCGSTSRTLWLEAPWTPSSLYRKSGLSFQKSMLWSLAIALRLQIRSIGKKTKLVLVSLLAKNVTLDMMRCPWSLLRLRSVRPGLLRAVST